MHNNFIFTVLIKPKLIELSVGLLCFILPFENTEVLRGLEAYTMPGVGGGAMERMLSPG